MYFQFHNFMHCCVSLNKTHLPEAQEERKQDQAGEKRSRRNVFKEFQMCVKEKILEAEDKVNKKKVKEGDRRSETASHCLRL